jgi:hypothetical protein
MANCSSSHSLADMIPLTLFSLCGSDISKMMRLLAGFVTKTSIIIDTNTTLQYYHSLAREIGFAYLMDVF